MDHFPQDTSKFKLIVSDVDGTLMGRDRIISDKNTIAIKNWQNNGRLFTIASGRQYFMLKNDIKNLEITMPVIVRGGSEIIDPVTDNVLYSQNIDADTLADFTKTLVSSNYDFMIEKDNALYGSYEYDISMYQHLIMKKAEDFSHQDAPKVNVPLGNRTIEEFEKFVNLLIDMYPQLNIVRSYNDLGKSLDVTSKSATKNLSVLELIKLLKLEREEVVGVGDGYNDFPLMEACGFKVAMGNAREELKAISDVIVPRQEEDGVAYLIEELLRRGPAAPHPHS